MNLYKISVIATSMIAFSTFLGGLIAMIYYFFLVRESNLLNVLIGGIIYIDINLIFLYILRKKLNERQNI